MKAFGSHPRIEQTPQPEVVLPQLDERGYVKLAPGVLEKLRQLEEKVDSLQVTLEVLVTMLVAEHGWKPSEWRSLMETVRLEKMGEIPLP